LPVSRDNEGAGTNRVTGRYRANTSCASRIVDADSTLLAIYATKHLIQTRKYQ